MPIHKSEYPILEYDDELNGVIMPNRNGSAMLPQVCIMCFFSEVIKEIVTDNNAEIKNEYISEMCRFPVYSFIYKETELCVIQAAVGSASIAMMAEFLIGNGVKYIIACGGCGVLTNIPSGDVIIPTSALRDEGVSYHYLPPSREIMLDVDVVNVIKDVLTKHKIEYIECKTWTTDAFFRETPDMIQYRREEGCVAVEMECSAIAAVARLRGVKFGQLLYSGDILFDTSNYDERGWFENFSARKKLLYLSLETAVKLLYNRLS